jgi:hypothetical protein
MSVVFGFEEDIADRLSSGSRQTIPSSGSQMLVHGLARPDHSIVGELLKIKRIECKPLLNQRWHLAARRRDSSQLPGGSVASISHTLAAIAMICTV